MANEEPGRIGAMIASQGWAALSGRQVRALTGIVHGPNGMLSAEAGPRWVMIATWQMAGVTGAGVMPFWR